MDSPFLRVLEIGDHDHFKHFLPDRTTLLWTGYRPPLRQKPSDYLDCTPQNFGRMMKLAQRGEFDLIVAHASQYPPWHLRNWVRSFRRRPHWAAAFSRTFGVQMLRLTRFTTPMIAIDMHDGFTIHRSNFFLLDRAKLYFKRELPVDAWQAVYGSAHPGLPTTRIRRNERWRRRIARLAPISLEIAFIDVGEPDDVFADKQFDIFFSGEVEINSTVRRDGIRQLEQLATHGIRVDIPSERLPRDEFYRRMSRSWLAWSPSGLGWDCYRHYEAPQCLTVPVINYPTIQRHHPMEDGVHAIYYAPEGDGLMRAVKQALTDKERLKKIAVGGRAHVRAHHVGFAFCQHIFDSMLSASEIP